MKKFYTLALAALATTGMANAQTVGNPLSGVLNEDGKPYYLVSYDLEKGEFKQELPEIDETFVFAIDFTGTGFEEELNKLPSNPRLGILGRSGAFDIFNEFNLNEDDPTATATSDGRLFPIDRKKNIYGMTLNLFQMMTTRGKDSAFGPDATWENYKVTEEGVQVAFGDNVFGFGWSKTDPGAEWWSAFCTPVQDVLRFQTAPYTGTKTGEYFTYGDLHPEGSEVPLEGLDNVPWEAMVSTWGGYGTPEDFAKVSGSFVYDEEGPIANPQDPEHPGSYLVAWDMENGTWCKTNPEIDETFVFAVDFSKSGLNFEPAAGELGRSAGFDIANRTALDDAGKGVAKADGRMFCIDKEKMIYGMTVNLYHHIVSRGLCEGFGPKDALWETFKVTDLGQDFQFQNNLFGWQWNAVGTCGWWGGCGDPITDKLNWFMAPYTGENKDGDFIYSEISGEDCPFEGMASGEGTEWSGYASLHGIALPQDFAKAKAISGVKNIASDNAQVVAVEYYNVAGARIQAPVENGITIVRKIMSNGAAKAVKVIR